MRTTCKIVSKIMIILLFLYITPFMNGFKDLFSEAQDVLVNLVYQQKTLDKTISIKEQLNVLSYNSNITIPKDEIQVETTQENPVTIPSTPKPKEEIAKTGKKIYIYNTHQEESYTDKKTVLDASILLAQHLEEKGFKVVVETNNFKNYRDQNGIAYDRAYVVSYKYLNDALVNYGGFDLCIDLHRDSIPRNASYKEANGKTYATAMMVIGGLGKNAKSATQISTTLTDTINTKVSGMMRSPMTREAFYNQEVHPNIVLMEVGGDVNSFVEVTNSLSVIADGIYDYLEKR
ncbi:MAG: stage II sporulation protein P [Longicatena sp.]